MALAANALTTVARLCQELKTAVPTMDSGDYAQLEAFINEVSAAVESYCSRSFTKATTTEAVAAYDTTVIKLSRYPLISIAAVLRDGAAESSDMWSPTPEVDDAAAGLLRNLISVWTWSADYTSSAAPEKHVGQERRCYSITYTAGYVLPKDATTESPRTLPYDLERAVLLACVSEYRNQGRNRAVASESLLSASVSYAQPASTEKSIEAGLLPVDAAILLDRYKRWA